MNSGKIHKKVSLRRKIFQYLLLTTFFSLILLASFWIESEVKNFKKEVKVLKSTFSETRKLEIKSKILEIKDWIYWIKLHPPEAFTSKKRAETLDSLASSEYFIKLLQDYCLDSISRVRYSEDEYVFINTLDGKALISNGKINRPPINIFNTGDTSWISIFMVEQLAESKSAGYFYTYPFKKISKNKISEKTSFFSYLPEWKWIIGTGYYEDDFNSIIELKRKTLFYKLQVNLLNFAPFFLFSILLTYLIYLFFSKRLSKNFNLFKDFFSQAVSEHNLINNSQVSYSEFEVLAETANKMIVESLKSEASLKISEEKYRFLFERNPASMLIYERNTFKILSVNDAFIKHYGYSYEEVTAMVLQDLYPDDEKTPITEFVKSVHGHAFAGEWHHIKKDGLLITIIVTSHDIKYLGRNARVAVIIDITDRKKTEEIIRFREQQLSLIYSNVFDAVYFLAVEDENRFRFLSVNITFLKLTGLQESQVVNKYLENIVPEPSLSIVVKNYIKAIQEKRTIQWEEISDYPTGKKFGLVSITPLFDSLGKCINLVGTVHDITERKHAEEELKLHRDHLEELVIQRTKELEIEKEHAQSADRLKSAFLATMSHELRTPLNSIIGFTGILMQERPGPLNDEQKKQLGMAQNSARHLLSLINDVLDISKIEAGQLKMNFQQFSLPEVIYKVVETNRQFADKKNLRIIVSISENIKNITSDNLRVQQILLNIINNAIKFTELGTISIMCYTEDDFIKIKITDTGIGIESDKLELLFKPFMQVDTGLTRKHEGTGLGLSICRRLTEMLGGKIEVKSKYREGSTFTVTLPMIIT